jgi:hypothetical protein
MGQGMNNISTGSHSTWGGDYPVDCLPLIHLLIHNHVTGIRQIEKNRIKRRFLGNKTDMLAGNVILYCVVEEQTGNILMHCPCISRKSHGRNHANLAGGGINIIGEGRYNIQDAEAGWRSIKEIMRSDVSNAHNNKSLNSDKALCRWAGGSGQGGRHGQQRSTVTLVVGLSRSVTGRGLPMPLLPPPMPQPQQLLPLPSLLQASQQPTPHRPPHSHFTTINHRVAVLSSRADRQTG